MIQINPRSKKSISDQIVFCIQESILTGTLEAGEKLPSVRELATMLTINPNTVAKAYLKLEQLMVISTYKGKGCYVNKNVQIVPNSIIIKELSDKLYEIIVEAYGYGIQLEELFSIMQELDSRKTTEMHSLKGDESND